MDARFSSMVPNASSVAARRIYGDFGAPLPLVVVVVSDIDSLTKHPSVICRKITGVGWIGRAAEAVPSVSRRSTPFQERTPDHRCSGGESHLGDCRGNEVDRATDHLQNVGFGRYCFPLFTHERSPGALATVGRAVYSLPCAGKSPPVAASRPPSATPVTHNSPFATLSSVSGLSSPAHTLPAKDRETRILLQGTDPFAVQSSPHRTPRCRHPMRSGERSLLALRKATRAPTVRTRRPGRPELRTEQHPDDPPDSGVSKLPTLRLGHSPGSDIVFSRP